MKNNKINNIWTTTANAASKNMASRANHRNTVGIGPRTVKSRTITVSSIAKAGKDKRPAGIDPEQGKLSLQDLEAELDRENGEQSLVDKEEKTKEVTVKKSWADIVRQSEFHSKAFSETVSMQGLGPICDPNSSLMRKLLWFAIVFLAIIFTGFNIFTQINMFVGQPITVRVDFRKAKDIKFPTVTICNNNFVSYRTTAALNGVAVMETMKPLLFEPRNSAPNWAAFDISFYRAMGWEVFFDMLAQNMSQNLLRCQWEQALCDFSNFSRVFTDMGVCYSFNFNGTLNVREAGRAYGLKLTLDTMQWDYLRSMDDYYGAGFRVVVHAPGVPPIMSEKGVAVSPGQHNFLAIDVKNLKNAEPSISGCGSKKLKYYPSSSTTAYSTEACRLECRSDYLNKSCGCRTMYMPNTDVRICDPPEFYSCFFPSLDTYLQSGSNQCEDLCPEPCSENQYRVTPSSNPFSDRFLSDFSALKGQDADYWRKNLLHLEIYLTSMIYEVVEKQLGYTLLQLFCDVGGAFGLLLGASLLTLLEIADFFICKLSTNGGVRR